MAIIDLSYWMNNHMEVEFMGDCGRRPCIVATRVENILENRMMR